MASPHKEDAYGRLVNNQEVQNSGVFTTNNTTSPNNTITTNNTITMINITSGATGQGYPVNVHDQTMPADLNETNDDPVPMDVPEQNGNPNIEEFGPDGSGLSLPRLSSVPRELFYGRPGRLGIIQGALTAEFRIADPARDTLVKEEKYRENSPNPEPLASRPVKGALGMNSLRRSEPMSAMTVDELMALGAATPDPFERERSDKDT
ncbi:hypothetical protein N7481_007202 [Penicillium waksmanii]|uniref:uncharacterized protein n=1 Tax=Penicillium waksmanii TaxID=69791 RepID=UPI0025465A77|nr:uncharacterized protein N7481_007202 [Penicillium waksmanii]KAJ5979904.1 hypothetical protein N7481_007202 [Penicillium waksmanii]